MRRVSLWLCVVAALAGAAAVLVDEAHGLAVTAPAHLAVLPVWLAFIAVGVGLIGLFDPFRAMRRHWPLLLLAALLGATAANAVAVYGNAPAGRWVGTALDLTPAVAYRMQAAFVAPVLEEAAKGACVLLVLLSARRLNRIAHALIIGMFTGFGFQIAENLNLATISALRNPISFGHGIEESMRYRLPSLLSSHWCYTGLTAVALIVLLPWFAERDRWSWRRRALTAFGLVTAALLMHGLWNLPQPPQLSLLVANSVKLTVNTVVLLTATLLLLRVERRHVCTLLTQEHDGPLAGCDPRVLDSLPTYRRRSTLRCAALRRAGPSGYGHVRRAQNRALAVVQAHMSNPMSRTRTECVRAPTAR